MSNVINLRQARKSAKRLADVRAAETNRAMHGRTKAERQRAEMEKLRADSHIEGARIERDDD